MTSVREVKVPHLVCGLAPLWLHVLSRLLCSPLALLLQLMRITYGSRAHVMQCACAHACGPAAARARAQAFQNTSTVNCLITNLPLTFAGHTNTIMCCRFDFSGINLCTCSMDRTALVWDIRMWRQLLKLRYCCYN